MRIRTVFVACIVALPVACHQGRPASFTDELGACRLPAAADAGASAITPQTAGATFDSAWSIIARTHWDTTFNGVNWRAVRDTLRPKAVRTTSNADLRKVLTSMLGTLGQSHFSIIPRASAVGGGAAGRPGSTGLTIRDADPEMLVTGVRPASPAARAGIRPGYALVAVNGCPLPPRRQFAVSGADSRTMVLNRWKAATASLQGAVGDSVRLTLRTALGQLVAVTAVLDAEPGQYTKAGNLPGLSPHLESATRSSGGRTIGIIKFNIWMPSLMPAIAAAVDTLRSADAIVLDLRGNLGGFGLMSAGVAGHFVDSALTLGTMVQRTGAQRYVINPQRVNGANRRVTPFSGPVAIVVDELSISTTEIFTAGLQALGRARVFGAQTAGQALPSVAEELPNGDVLYHAIANFLSPAGHPVEGAGVIPDVSVPVTRKALLAGLDPALDAAIAWAAGFPSQSAARRK